MSKPRSKKSQPPAAYRSGYERQIRSFLLTNKIPFDYETIKFKLVIPASNHRCAKCRSTEVERQVSYTPDFILKAKDIIVEAKGKFTARDRKIALAMRQQYPLENYRMMFQRDNWLSSKKAQRYSDWCKKHAIDYHIGTDMPKEWWA